MRRFLHCVQCVGKTTPTFISSRNRKGTIRPRYDIIMFTFAMRVCVVIVLLKLIVHTNPLAFQVFRQCELPGGFASLFNQHFSKHGPDIACRLNVNSFKPNWKHLKLNVLAFVWTQLTISFIMVVYLWQKNVWFIEHLNFAALRYKDAFFSRIIRMEKTAKKCDVPKCNCIHCIPQYPDCLTGIRLKSTWKNDTTLSRFPQKRISFMRLFYWDDLFKRRHLNWAKLDMMNFKRNAFNSSIIQCIS